MSSIHDVARAAGVSIATVSRAFNNQARVKDETRQRILKLAHELNYSPHVAARNLRRRRENRDQLHYCIGLAYKGKSIFQRSAFDLALATHLEHQLHELGFSLRLFQCGDDQRDSTALLSAPVDGIICTFANQLSRDVAAQLPCILIDCYEALSTVYGIMPDYRSGLMQACAYLIKHGHRDIVACSEAQEQHASSVLSFTQMVRDGMEQAFKETGLKLSAASFAGSANTVASGYHIAAAILKRRTPDAIIASDQAMLGIYKAVNEQGLSIGTDISLIGIDGMPEAAYLYPALTSIDMHIPEIAKRAASVLQDWICNNNAVSGMDLIPVDLIYRDSVRSS